MGLTDTLGVSSVAEVQTPTSPFRSSAVRRPWCAIAGGPRPSSHGQLAVEASRRERDESPCRLQEPELDLRGGASALAIHVAPVVRRRGAQEQRVVSVQRARGGNGWRVRWREAGRQHERKFELKRDADAFDREVKRRQQLGPLGVQQLTAGNGPTLDQWIEHRWVPAHAATLEQSRRDRYANVYKCHIWGPLGDAQLGQLTVARLREWQAALIRADVSPGTVHKCRTFLSSVLRHAAESEAIPGNPLSLVRPPKPRHRDAVQPLSPATVEAIRRTLLDPPPREVAAGQTGQRDRRRYELPAPGTPQTRRRDALIASLLAYAGLRPGELRALRWGDVGEHTLLVQGAANPDGSIKATKNERRRSVRLLSSLARELRDVRLTLGQPPDAGLLLAPFSA
jgi:integrase